MWSDATGRWECSETADPYQTSDFSIRQNKLVGNTYDKLSFIKRRIIQLSRSINIDKNHGNMDLSCFQGRDTKLDRFLAKKEIEF